MIQEINNDNFTCIIMEIYNVESTKMSLSISSKVKASSTFGKSSECLLSTQQGLF